MKAIVHRWSKLQISHRGGTYSVERMLALGEYTQNTSLMRVVLVCLATPIPMIVVIILQELIPLQDPRDGWSENFGFWLRLAILAGVICGSVVVHAKHMIDGISLSAYQVVTLGILVGVTFPPIGMVVAALWVFPVPFIALLLDGLYIVEIVAAFRLIIGHEGFKSILSQRYECFQYVQFVSSQVLLSVVYPAYQGLFNAAAGTRYEILVILLLPAMKLTMKNLLSLTISHLEDMLPLEVIFVVDFFNAFYLVTCVQSASSTSAVAAILAIDISQSVLELYRFYGRTRSIARKEKKNIGTGDLNNLVLLSAVQTVCESADRFDSHLLPGIRLRSNPVLQTQNNGWLGHLEKRRQSDTTTYQTSPDASMVNNNLSSISPSRGKQTIVSNILNVCMHRNGASVQPLGAVIMPVKASSSVENGEVPTNQHMPINRQPNFLTEALEVVFTSECLVLTEYLEAVIPILYGLYVKVLVNLPSAQYHIELVGTTVDNVDTKLQSIFVYAMLEFISLALLVLVMQKNCGVRALYQLAFVFETQTILVQAKLVTWALITLCFRVVHFGKLIEPQILHGSYDATPVSVCHQEWISPSSFVGCIRALHSKAKI
ncbi:unnamed protein product [Phytophthora fragariaefolia]|uniref:Unnamed protein product n=1 Tax=Phytophthora fragariaefolia TaxID=1490495 RepID=A0A9W6UE67_9STRA|nr:unnamed protein product [Phytophthora fragariaefolia]